MQARIDAIGAKLVPKYQFEFPYTEETRIDFRFYLVDAPKWRDAMPLPNGIVLVPYQLVGWMQNDSQLAAILADKVACLLEKQPMFLPATDADLAMDAAELGARVVPFVGPAEDIAGLTFGVNSLRQTHLRRQQRDRVSLALMHDAGYDVMQAPIAWWLLSSKKQKDVAEIPQPARAKYFYEVLGETWASELATTESAPATAAPQ
jgi:predicted Zn-dependent protease